MGTVYKKQTTRPMPPNAELFTRRIKNDDGTTRTEQWAKWRDGRGRTRQARVTDAGRIATESSTYYAEYRDGAGIVRTTATACKDKGAALTVLSELMRRAEMVRGGVVSATEDSIADYRALPLESHIAAYLISLEATGTTKGHIDNVGRYLRGMATECGFDTLAKVDRAAFERSLVRAKSIGISARAQKMKLGLSNRSCNAYRAAWTAFLNWCVANRRLVSNPLAGVGKANEKTDPRRQRRSFTEDEMRKLLDAARTRPLQSASKNNGGDAELKPATRQRLEMLGRERALIYKTLFLTGLRRGELASLTVGALVLDGPHPHAMLHAADEKNRRGSQIPLRADLVADMQSWLADKLEARRNDSRRLGAPIPARLESKTPLFNVPDSLVKIFDRDLKTAGIAKRDERGRTVDVHSLRTSFGTHLSKGGVTLRTAQAALRHSTPVLTANTYTDPQLLDVAGALDVLPALPLDGADLVAVNVAVAGGKSCDSESCEDNAERIDRRDTNTDTIRKIVNIDRHIQRQATRGAEKKMVEMNGIEPSTSCLPDKRSPN